MLEFLSSNWLWILLIGGMLFMHLGHGGHGGHGGGGGHRHSGDHSETSAGETREQPHDHRTGNSPRGDVSCARARLVGPDVGKRAGFVGGVRCTK